MKANATKIACYVFGVTCVQVLVALVMTVVANRYNLRYTGWVVLGLWIGLSVAGGLLNRKSISVMWNAILFGSLLLPSLVLYVLIGRCLLGWTGLVK